MRVLHVIASLDAGGAERLVVEYAWHHDRSRYEPEVCCLNDGGPLLDELRGLGVRTHILGREGRFDLGAFFALVRLIARGRYDVVHNHNATAMALGVPAAILGGARVIVRTEHNVVRGTMAARRAMSRLAALRENAQIAVSRAVRESHVAAGRIPRRRFAVIENGIDDARLERGCDRATARERLGVADDRVVCLTVGSLTPQKDHANLLEAAAALAGKGLFLQFFVVGGGPLKADLERRADELGLGETVRFLGQRLDVHDLLRGADIFVLPSAWEGLPITILEAMASGLPCVATAVGGVPEMMADGVDGLVVPPGDAWSLADRIGLLAGDGELRKRLALAARATYERRFRALLMVRRTEALYDLALAGRAEQAASDRIKVVYAITQLGRGGAERQLAELVSRLPENRFAPVVCSLSAPGPLGHEMESHGVPVVTFGKKRGVMSGSSWKLLRLLLRERPAVLHTYLFSANWRGLLAGRLARVPLVISSVRNVDVHAGSPLALLDRFFSILVDRVIVNAEAVKRYVVERRHVDPGVVRVIYNGISRVREDPARPPAGGEGGKTVVAVASLTRKKDHATFLAAAAAVKERVAGVRFVVVGDGPLRAELARTVRTLGLEDDVEFLGGLEDARQVIEAADVSVLTSRKEGCSNAILEAMASGRPVVATDVGGNRELVEDGVNGFIVAAGDHTAAADRIASLLSDAELARKMGEAGRARAHVRFRAERMVEETVDYYCEILRERAPGLCEWVDGSYALPGGER